MSDIVDDPSLTVPYGSWKSSVMTDQIAAKTIGLSSPILDGQSVYWLESRPQERGRSVIVYRTQNGDCVDLTPPSFNVRSRVHEYGGGEFTVFEGTIYFVNFEDQRIYQQLPGQQPTPITFGKNLRYADLTIVPGGRWLIAVREDHRSGETAVVNTLVMLDVERSYDETILTRGNDFYAFPAVDSTGSRLAWITWNHPDMPWDGTELWLADLADQKVLVNSRRLAGSRGESILQPRWSPDDLLYFISDRHGWWNLYRMKNGGLESVCRYGAEFGRPPWTFGQSTYVFESPTQIICAYSKAGSATLARLHTDSGQLKPIKTPHTDFQDLKIKNESIVFAGGSPSRSREIVKMDLSADKFNVLRRSVTWELSEDQLSVPEAIEFLTENGVTAYALFYPPKNDCYHAPEDELPPLIVVSHGGPTSASDAVLDPMIQFWTSRGIALVDVNYGGSTGYGRSYRERLNGQWGVADVDDCVNAAKHLISQGRVDPNRIAIRGRSAGGYTVLSALAFRDFFRAGASYYGISDLEALVAGTHKFESRYLDSLVGPYPECADLYRSRSPIHSAEKISSPMILFQGMDDKVVPDSQAVCMASAMRENGLAVTYVAFEGEGHGFRMAASIKSAMENELYFYGQVFSFTPSDDLAHIGETYVR